MYYIPYNSRKEYHKSLFGAVEEDTEVIYRVVMPRNLSVSAVYFTFKEDGWDGYDRIPMEWERMEGENEEWWRASVTVKNSGLYWYHFEYDTPFGRSFIKRKDGADGSLDGEGRDWQITVYKKDFKTPDFFKGGIIYQIFPDRFCNSKTEKKGVPGDRVLRDDWGNTPCWRPDEKGIVKNNDFFGGDFRGIEEKLDYISSLGVNCIYLNPVFRAQSNHRYDTGDYEVTDPLLGDEKDFRSLCKKAKSKGIRIILDGVFSHTGIDSRYFNFYGSYEGEGAYRSRESEYFDWYKFRNWPDDYECWWGIKILPEVNEENESYLEYITGKNGILRKWLRAGASGWRLDVADELPDVFLDRLRKAVKEENEDALIMGEVWEDASNKFSYSKRRRYLLGDQLDSVMNYPFSEAVIHFVRTGITEGFSEKIMSVLENYPKQVTDVLMNHIGSHDTARIITTLAGEDASGKGREWQFAHHLEGEGLAYGKRLLKIAAAMQFTLPGIPSVYYGDEAGMQGYGDPFNRGCYPWGQEDEELIEYYRLLGKLRRESDCFVDGKFEIISDISGCIAFSRHGKKDSVLVISNRNPHEIDYYTDERWNDAKVLTGGEKYESFVRVPGETSAILRLTIQ